MNQVLYDWFEAGIQEHMQQLSTAEEHWTTATQLAATEPSPTTLDGATRASREIVSKARHGLSWLSSHPCPDELVGSALAKAYQAYRHAGRDLVEMGDGHVPMTPLSGEIAAYSIFIARRRLYDATARFVEEVGR